MKKHSRMRRGVFILSCALNMLILLAATAFGSGFALIEQSVSGLGNAFAGGAASAEDASTIFYNPAGLTRLGGTQVVGGAHLIFTSAKFKDGGSTNILGGSLGTDAGGDAGGAGFVPNLYISKKLSNSVFLGLGVNAPFGLASKYNDTWIGRYYAINSEMLTVNINPSAAFKVNEQLSIGAGLNIQYIKAKLSSAVDLGLLMGPATAGMFDGYANLEGDSWGVGYNLGILYEFTKDTRAGIAYRSRIKQGLEGNVAWQVNPTFAAAVLPRLLPATPFVDGGISADVTLPDTLSFSLYHRVNSNWAVMADVTWTDWSVFRELVIDFANPYDPDSKMTTNWKNTYRYSFGIDYMPNDRLTYRAGIAFDESPVPDAAHATPRIPDGDRFWTALGVGYRISDNVQFDLGFAHLFIKDPEIWKTAIPGGEDERKGNLRGSYDASVNIASAQIKWIF